jgi:flagellar basal-body rod modification protein FlgD
MQVTAATTTDASAKTAASASPTVDYNAFLRLLIAQMKNQDPTNPTDSTQFMAQLASFSNVEQAVQTNAKLDALLTSSAVSQADGLIGKIVTSADATVSGTVVAVTLLGSKLVATLDSGAQLAIGDGMTVR